MRRWLGAACGWGLMGSTALAHAEPAPAAASPTAPSPTAASPSVAPPDASPDDPVPFARAQRRAGFILGVMGGLLSSTARGYPNDVAKIDLPEYEAHTGLGMNAGGAFWVGGSLADWLNLSVGMLGGSTKSDGLNSSGAAFSVRIESFPLFYRGGAWRDAGLLLTAGLGGYSIKRGKETLAQGEGTSAVGAGVFYEPWRWWHLSFGPQLEYNHQFSRSMSAHTLVLGVRTVFYGGP
jgi:hypothetical protein